MGRKWLSLFILCAMVGLAFGCTQGVSELQVTEDDEKIPVIFSHDGASDDLATLVYIANHPQIDLIGVINSYGIQHPATSFYSWKIFLYDVLDLDEVQFSLGSELPMDPAHNKFPINWRNSADSFNALPLPEASEVYSSSGTGADLIIRLVKESPEKVTILATGAETDVALALQKDPGIAENIEQIVVMGGAFNMNGNLYEAPGYENNTVAEWNIYVDPLAAKIVFNSEIPISVVSLDGSDNFKITKDDYDKIKDSVDRGLSILAQDWKSKASGSGFKIWDIVAGVALTNPEFFEWSYGDLDVVAEQGDTHGQTIQVNSDSEIKRFTSKTDYEKVRAAIHEVFRLADEAGQANYEAYQESMRATQQAMAQIKITDIEGNEVVYEDDSLKAEIVSDPTGSSEYKYQWYRNGITLEGENEPILTNEAMKTFIGNPNEYTPASEHTDHTISGYQYSVDVINEIDELIGSNSVTISVPLAEFEMRGINFTTFCRHFMENNQGTDSLEVLKNRINPNYVSILNIFFQEGNDAKEIYALENTSDCPSTRNDDELLDLINSAHELGIEVVYHPQIWLSGDYQSRQENFEISDDWFGSYKDFIVQQADIAQKNNVELFVIGSRLYKSEMMSDKWIEIIDLVREHYDGEIVYMFSSNIIYELDKYSSLPWVSELDYIGYSFERAPIEIVNDVRLSEIEPIFDEINNNLSNLVNRLNKKVIILHSQFDSFDGAVARWFYEDINLETPDFQEQADYINSFIRFFGSKEYVEGIFWYEWTCSQENWYHIDLIKEDWTKGHLFIEKPAERVLSSWYGGDVP